MILQIKGMITLKLGKDNKGYSGFFLIKPEYIPIKFLIIVKESWKF